MDKKQAFEKKLFAAARAALYGAILFDGLIVLSDYGYRTWARTHHGFLSDLINSVGWLLAIPPIMTGANSFLVDGLLGAFLFGFVALFWHFVIKTYENEPTNK